MTDTPYLDKVRLAQGAVDRPGSYAHGRVRPYERTEHGRRVEVGGYARFHAGDRVIDYENGGKPGTVTTVMGHAPHLPSREYEVRHDAGTQAVVFEHNLQPEPSRKPLLGYDDVPGRDIGDNSFERGIDRYSGME